jgi:hypothetical protein
MNNENQNECHCSQAACGCEAAPPARCSCQEICNCSRACRCDDSCGCSDKQ